jgi:hypothetical protein
MGSMSSFEGWVATPKTGLAFVGSVLNSKELGAETTGPRAKINPTLSSSPSSPYTDVAGVF